MFHFARFQGLYPSDISFELYRVLQPTIPKEDGTGPLPAWLGCPMAVAVALLSKAATLLFPPEFNKSFTPPKEANLWSKVEPLSCWCVSKKDEWIFA